MDSPTDTNINDVRLFLDFLSTGTEQPVVLLGNHDVRDNGYLAENYGMLMRLPGALGGVTWFDDLQLGVVSFNSVMDGKLAQGYVGAEQLMDLGNQIERKVAAGDYSLIGALHHHPTPVECPDWYTSPWYERVLGRTFERTEALIDADAFVRFAEERRLIALLHGHKHIPRIDKTARAGIPIYGCGSSVGKVLTRDRHGTYMSINVVSVDTLRRRVSGRLLAERIPGAALEETDRHEMVYRPT